MLLDDDDITSLYVPVGLRRTGDYLCLGLMHVRLWVRHLCLGRLGRRVVDWLLLLAYVIHAFISISDETSFVSLTDEAFEQLSNGAAASSNICFVKHGTG